MSKTDVKYYEKQSYLNFAINSLLFNEYHKTQDVRIKESIERVVLALSYRDLKDERTFRYVFNELMILGVNSKDLEWDISSMLVWCKDFNKGIHYPIHYGDRINGKDINIVELTSYAPFADFSNCVGFKILED